MKLHLTASDVRLESAAARRKLSEVVREAAAQDLAIGDAGDAETFIRTILPAAGKSWVQIAHAGGGFPAVARLGLTREEESILRGNCAASVCQLACLRQMSTDSRMSESSCPAETPHADQ